MRITFVSLSFALFGAPLGACGKPSALSDQQPCPDGAAVVSELRDAADGKVGSERCMLGDQANGPSVTWSKGKKVSDSNYARGKLHGRHREWNEGVPHVDFGYADGVLEGPCTWFDSAGKKTLEATFVKGAPAGVVTSWQDGIVIRQGECADGSPRAGTWRCWSPLESHPERECGDADLAVLCERQ